MHLSNTSAVQALDMETMRSRILCRKLCFLQGLLDERATGVGAAALKSLTDNVASLCLRKECRELESYYGNNFTDTVLVDADNVAQRIINTIGGLTERR